MVFSHVGDIQKHVLTRLFGSPEQKAVGSNPAGDASKPFPQLPCKRGALNARCPRWEHATGMFPGRSGGSNPAGDAIKHKASRPSQAASREN